MKLKVMLTKDRVVTGTLVQQTDGWLYLDEDGFSHMIDMDYVVSIEIVEPKKDR